MQEDELREKIDDYIDRFRMQWKVEGDEYHQSELIEDIVQLIKQYSKDYADREYEYIASKDHEYIQNIEWIRHLEDTVARENTEESKHRLEIAKSHASGYERGVRAVFESKRQRNQGGSK